MPLKVKKTVDMHDDYDAKELTKLHDKLVLSTCCGCEKTYDEAMLTFEQHLQRLVNSAFKLGQENPL